MSVLNTNSVNAINVNKSSVNESNLNDTTKTCENRELNENSKTKLTTMPAATNTMSATVTVLNSNTPFPSSDQCSDSEEDFDRTTRNLGAHKWIFNYKEVSSSNLFMLFFKSSTVFKCFEKHFFHRCMIGMKKKNVNWSWHKVQGYLLYIKRLLYTNLLLWGNCRT